MARRGARTVVRKDEDGGERGIGEEERRRLTAPPPAPRKWERDDGAVNEWQDTSRSRGRKPAGPSAQEPAAAVASKKPLLPPEVATDIRRMADVATPRHREQLVERTEAAYAAYERARFEDAYRAIKPVAEEVPTVAAVRELAGLAAYRSSKWRDAVRHLEAFSGLTGISDHLPVMMDCQRALHKPKKVAQLWTELRQSSPEADVLAEGRLVAAGTLAENGDLEGALSLLTAAGATKSLRNPSTRHVRQWYVLADLYERAGDVPKAREYFERVARVDPEAYDVAARLASLGPTRRPRSSRPSRPGGTSRENASSRSR